MYRRAEAHPLDVKTNPGLLGVIVAQEKSWRLSVDLNRLKLESDMPTEY
jgi:hypothetical protein